MSKISNERERERERERQTDRQMSKISNYVLTFSLIWLRLRTPCTSARKGRQSRQRRNRKGTTAVSRTPAPVGTGALAAFSCSGTRRTMSVVDALCSKFCTITTTKITQFYKALKKIH